MYFMVPHSWHGAGVVNSFALVWWENLAKLWVWMNNS